MDAIKRSLERSLETAVRAGVKEEKIVIDPGIGFAKTAEQSIELIRNSEKLLALGYPLLSGPSRKSFLGQITGEKEPSRRDYATCGVTIASAAKGYSIIRVHNVKAAADCLKVYFACMDPSRS